ncbi:hypothetical protein CLV38_12541 [Alkalibacterium olivapovliticus]|uniref:Uncharacterized protein n=1 Tax=Alkalibacterium olivapovliticus TaxID=99907 RepID=A0A2T0W126_9LACT|nr:hypothetical protein CLV38_12541 [Alkalibacterium olivapovliticus]
MINLHKNQVKFNSNITIFHTDGRKPVVSVLDLSVKQENSTFNTHSL